MSHETDLPGVVAPEPVTYWVLYDDGSAGRIESTSGEPVLNRPGRLVTEAEYQQRIAELEAANAAWIAEQQAADTARQREDYLALRAAGVPEATARRLSGYEGEDVEQ
ncbi:hypothetical protein ACFWH1_18300 [Streptomyces sp. NPDC127037]|uniref:hypothetical protein n=1 Tax=Streptomyces sp. NPDC127037 TaxID=3347113 RepID=UPI003661BDF1